MFPDLDPDRIPTIVGAFMAADRPARSAER